MAKYKGFTNFETWQVAVTIANTYNLYEHWNCVALNASNSKDPKAVIAAELERHFIDGFQLQDSFGNEVWEELMHKALGKIDWFDVADDIISGLDGRAVANG